MTRRTRLAGQLERRALDHRRAGALDRRLLAPAVPAAVLDQVIREHETAGRDVCAGCGYVPTRQRPVCRSLALALSLRYGLRRPLRWYDDEPTAAPAPRSPVEQDELFGVGEVQR